jgi:glycosyltransferase involved in cell wall biosynthesis
MPRVAQPVRRAGHSRGREALSNPTAARPGAGSPIISIITPVWNGLPFLRECIQSVLAQDVVDWELLVSDDGSTDGSRDWLASLDDPRIRIFTQSKNLGIFGNLNFLFERAAAPISQILCQDDYFIDAGSLSRLIALWNKAPAPTGFIRENWTAENSTNEIGRWGLQHLPALIEPHDSDMIFFVFGCIAGNLSNISLRTPLVRTIGGFDQRLPYAGDYDFWCRAGRTVPFLLEPSNLTYVRRHSGQASMHLNRHGELIAQQYQIVDDLFRRLRNSAPELLLKAHSTLQFDAFQRWVAVRQLLSMGDRRYLRNLSEHGSRHGAFLPGASRWLLFALSGGGRWGASLTARRLIAGRRRFQAEPAGTMRKAGSRP